MKVFNRDGKINFVDENNVFVGFDMQQDCCEHFDARVVEFGPSGAVALDDQVFPGFTFDKDQNLIPYEKQKISEFVGDCENGNWVAFRLSDKNGKHVYVVLENSHNGYYAHGWEFGIDGESTIESGSL